MDIIQELKEYKSKVEALAAKAAEADSALEQVESLQTEKTALTDAIVLKETALNDAAVKIAELEASVADLNAEIIKRDEEKKASDEKALEIVANLGLKDIPVITVTSTAKPTAEQIRSQYLAITDPLEKGRFFAENRNTILNGVVE
jgi:predicted ribonuclease YlaK